MCGVVVDKIQEMNAYAVVLCDNKVLLMKRNNDMWEFPGGGVDFGEHPYTSAIRECKEETDLDVSNGKFLTITSAVYEKNHSQKHSVYAVYVFDLKCSDNGDGNTISNDKMNSVKMNFEHKEYKWVDTSSESLKNYKLALNVKPVIKELLHYLSERKK